MDYYSHNQCDPAPGLLVPIDVLRFSVDAMIAKYQCRPSDVLATLALAEQLENADRHRWNVGDQQHADAQYDEERDDVPVELGQRLGEAR